MVLLQAKQSQEKKAAFLRFLKVPGQYQLKLVEIWLSGNSSFYLVLANHGPDKYTLYREGRINWFTQRVGLDNCYCNYLAICRYFFQNKKLFQSWMKYLKSLIRVLHFFLWIYSMGLTLSNQVVIFMLSWGWHALCSCTHAELTCSLRWWLKWGIIFLFLYNKNW